MTEISCTYEEHKHKSGETVYKCRFTVPQNLNYEKFVLIGTHLPEKSDTDVLYVEVHGAFASLIPIGLTKHFPNMKTLGLYFNGFVTFTRYHLAEYGDMEKLIGGTTLLNFAPRDIVEEFKNIKHIDYDDGKLRIFPETIEIPCKYEEHTFQSDEQVVYKCQILFPRISKYDEFKFIGTHLSGKSDSDVIFVVVGRDYCTIIPQGLTKHFPNMKAIGIYNNFGFSTITKELMAEYKNLERFICHNSSVRYLSRDIFEGFENLKHIDFFRNKLTFVEPNILDGLDKLEYVNFLHNRNYNKIFTKSHFYSCSTLDGMKSYLFDRFLLLDEERILKYMENYPDKLKLWEILKEEAIKVNSKIEKHEMNFRFIDQNKTKIAEERAKFELEMDLKIEKLEKSKLELSKKLEGFRESELKLKQQIEELKTELNSERDEKQMFVDNFQLEIDKLVNQLQAINSISK